MRTMLISLAVLALAGCGGQETAANTDGCARAVTREVTWSSTDAQDTVAARAEGPTCTQAAVILTIRSAGGELLWAFADSHYRLTLGEAPPEGGPETTPEEMDTFLDGWANVSLSRSGELPEWREGVASLSASAQTFSYDTPFDRETYEMLRGRNLAMLCYAAAPEGTECLIIDPITDAPIRMVAYGP